MKSTRALRVFLCLTLWPFIGNCATFTIPANGDSLVGQVVIAESRHNETMAEVGRRYDMGIYEMMEANPNISEDDKLTPGTRLVIPSRFVLPPGPREGVVINLAELRLYFYPKEGNQVVTSPVGIGREGWETPLGTTKIVEKTKDPYWYPPQSVREDAAAKGYILPDSWPPGPDNPLGAYMLRMGWRTYLIHGTNNPEGIGKRSSAGCMRMFPEDIELLFGQIPLGTPVTIINRPVKVGLYQGCAGRST